MEIKLEEIKTPMIVLNGKSFYPEEIQNVIDALEKCHNRLMTVQISNQQLKQELKKENVIRFNSSGGAFTGDNFNKFKEEISCILQQKNSQ